MNRAADLLKKKRLDRKVKHFMKARAHLRTQITLVVLQKYTSFLSIAEVTVRIKKIHTARNDMSRLGDEFNPRHFTEFFADKFLPELLFALQKFSMPREMEKTYRRAIRRAKI